MSTTEFAEIGHSGGIVTITVIDDPGGRRKYQLGWRHARPVPAALFAVWALPQGIPVATCRLGGMVDPDKAEEQAVQGPKNVFQVMIGSDSQGHFGHECPRCNKYWRSGGAPTTCPYCGMQADQYQFLSKAQRAFVQQYMALLMEALHAEKPGEYKIDLDAVADAVGKEGEKPAFYYADESQQNKFTCSACGEFNDVLGTYCYCSGCGTRNDMQEVEGIIKGLRERIRGGTQNEACVRDLVSAFDSFCGRYMEQLLLHVPLSSRRTARLKGMRFHNLRPVVEAFANAFDIDIVDGMKPEDVAFLERMFHRRHVYEHKGGEADEKYIQDSGDTSVRPKQALRETQESAYSLATAISRLAANVHRGFHDILQPDKSRITQYKRWHK